MPPQTAPPPEPVHRTGPSPLPLHLGLSNLIWLSWPLLWQRLQPKSPTLKPSSMRQDWSQSLQQRAAKLAAQSAKLPPERWLVALAAEGLKRQRAYLAGVKLYRRQALVATSAPPLLLQQIGTTKLLDFAPQLQHRPALLVIPSLINSARILDLSPERSFLRWLVQQNIRPLLIDWDMPRADEAGFSVSDYSVRLQQFLPMLRQRSPSPIHIFGHCLGGNLALALCALAPQQFRSLTLCSTPWDFHAGDPTLGQQAKALWQKIAAQKNQAGLIPASLLQSLFALLQPMAVTDKFRRLSIHPPSTVELQHFTRVEDWLNDGVPVTRKVLEEIVRDWYGRNLPVSGGWRVGTTHVRPRNINLPTLIAIPEQDHIVPPASSAALARQLTCARLLPVPLGHIGMIVSRRAESRFWQPFAAWVNDFSQ